MILTNCALMLAKTINSNDVILDIGCCRGESKRLFPNNKIIGYDPVDLPERADAFRNGDEYYQKAVVGTRQKEVPFIIESHNYISRIGTSELLVPAVSFLEVIEKHKEATVLKIDVEGAELDYPFEHIPEAIRLCAIEWHNMAAPQIEGFELAFSCRYRGYAKSMNTDAIYIRESKEG